MIALPPKFVAFDLETTGLVNRKDEIIEIGAVKFTVEVKNGRVVPKLISEFDTLVKPNMLIPAEATNVNHITDKMVENAPPVGEALKQFTAFSALAPSCSLTTQTSTPASCAPPTSRTRSSHQGIPLSIALLFPRPSCRNLQTTSSVSWQTCS